LSDTDRLGLFVVSRLAQRLDVRVSLRPSPYGGTTAVVFIPASLLTETGEDTGSTPVNRSAEPRGAGPAGDTEHTFRQWGLDGVGGEVHKEHAAHRDESAVREPAGEEEPEPGDPVPLPRRRRRRRNAPVLVSDHGRLVSGPEQAAQEQPEQPAPGTRTKPGKRSGSAAGGTELPRRVRQASLAPQLRAEAAGDAVGADRDGDDRERSADEVRDRMAALQRGWQRGRELAEAEPADDPSTSVPRTTPEGNGR
jgi:hypothetical protein